MVTRCSMAGTAFGVGERSRAEQPFATPKATTVTHLRVTINPIPLAAPCAAPCAAPRAAPFVAPCAAERDPYLVGDAPRIPGSERTSVKTNERHDAIRRLARRVVTASSRTAGGVGLKIVRDRVREFG